jgi:hypothetical protein
MPGAEKAGQILAGQTLLGQLLTAQLLGARLEVDGAIRLLESPSPDSLDRCARILETASQRIAEFQPRSGEGGRTSVTHTSNGEEARRLRSSVLRAGRLLEGAASFHFNWGRMRDTLCAGYTRQGDPAKAPPKSRISVQG